MQFTGSGTAAATTRLAQGKHSRRIFHCVLRVIGVRFAVVTELKACISSGGKFGFDGAYSTKHTFAFSLIFDSLPVVDLVNDSIYHWQVAFAGFDPRES
jgi:hypothetical protein